MPGTQNNLLTVARAIATARPVQLGDLLTALPTPMQFEGYSATALEVALAAGFAVVSTLILPPGAYTISDNYTIASGKILVQLPGAVVTVAATKTLTCTGTSIRFLDADQSGTVSGAGQLLITTTNT